MKTNYVVLQLCLLLSVVNTNAQEKVEVTVAPKKMSQGVQTAFTVYIPESKPKMVENQWKKFINERSFFDFATVGAAHTVEKAWIGISNIFSIEKKEFEKKSLKVEKKGDELIVKDVIHEEVTQDHIDVFINQKDQSIQSEVVRKQEMRVAEFEAKLTNIY